MRSLTAGQKREIRILQREVIVKTNDRSRAKILIALVRRGIVENDPKSGTYYLAQGWESRDLLDGLGVPDQVVFEHKREQPDRPSESSIVRAPWTKPSEGIPSKISRPPAIYSNRSQEELIDHILKNY